MHIGSAGGTSQKRGHSRTGGATQMTQQDSGSSGEDGGNGNGVAVQWRGSYRAGFGW
jgi:hypothetical protein